jgi:hypothetical protein
MVDILVTGSKVTIVLIHVLGQLVDENLRTEARAWNPRTGLNHGAARNCR